MSWPRLSAGLGRNCWCRGTFALFPGISRVYLTIRALVSAPEGHSESRLDRRRDRRSWSWADVPQSLCRTADGSNPVVGLVQEQHIVVILRRPVLVPERGIEPRSSLNLTAAAFSGPPFAGQYALRIQSRHWVALLGQLKQARGPLVCRSRLRRSTI
jgi:hypothetical protein